MGHVLTNAPDCFIKIAATAVGETHDASSMALNLPDTSSRSFASLPVLDDHHPHTMVGTTLADLRIIREGWCTL